MKISKPNFPNPFFSLSNFNQTLNLITLLLYFDFEKKKVRSLLLGWLLSL